MRSHRTKKGGDLGQVWAPSWVRNVAPGKTGGPVEGTVALHIFITVPGTQQMLHWYRLFVTFQYRSRGARVPGGMGGLYSESVSKGTAWAQDCALELPPSPWAWPPGAHGPSMGARAGRPGRPWFSPLCSHLQTPDQYRGNTYWVFTLCPGFIHSFIQFSWQTYEISIILFLIILFYYISIFIVLLRKQTQRLSG